MEKMYNDLINAYSEQNLNRITGKLIDLYKNRNYSTIRGNILLSTRRRMPNVFPNSSCCITLTV